MSEKIFILFLLFLLSSCQSTRVHNQIKPDFIYHIVIDRYNKGDCQNCILEKKDYSLRKYQGGNFNGITNNLEHIKSMGFNAILITPILENTLYERHAHNNKINKNAHSYHGYHTKNFTKIDRHFGSSDDLQYLIKKCHVLGMRIYLDIVINHSFNLFDINEQTTIQESSDKRFPEWMNYRENFNLIRSYETGMNKIKAQSSELYGLDDFNTEKIFVQNELIKIYTNLFNTYSFDGARLDSAYFVDEEFLKKIISKLSQLRSSKFKIFTENDKIVEGRESYFDLELFNLINKHEETINEKLIGFLTSQPKQVVNLLSSHDFGRFDPKVSLEKKIMFYKLLVALQKDVLFYYGEEYPLKLDGTFSRAREALFLKKNAFKGKHISRYKNIFTEWKNKVAKLGDVQTIKLKSKQSIEINYEMGSIQFNLSATKDDKVKLGSYSVKITYK